MPQTPSTAAAPYCTAERLWMYTDWKIVADLVHDDPATATAPQASLESAADDDGKKVYAALLAASGELESACLARGLYTPADLAALAAGTAGKNHLERVTAGLAIGVLFGRRYPASGRHEEIPACRYAGETIERLRVGDRVFGFVENADAGAGMSVTPAHPNLDTAREKNTVAAAYRFFGDRGYRGWGE